MLQVKINNKNDLVKAINAINIKKIICNEVRDQKELNVFIANIKSLMSTPGTLTLIAIKE